MIYRKETSFDTWINYKGFVFFVYGRYYYAPNEKNGEYPNEFTQDESKLVITSLEHDNKSCMSLLNNIDQLQEIEELVWEQLLSEDE